MRTLSLYAALLLFLLPFAACQTGGIDADEKERVAALEGLPRKEYASGGVAFSLAEIEGLRATNKDSVPWAMYMEETEDNGQLGYYFYPGYSRDLSSPNIRVEYMSKALKGCSSVDSLFIWLKSMYIGTERNGKVAGESTVGTLDGQEIKVLEIEIPKFQLDDSTIYSEKHMAWAYADHKDRFVGFSYSAVSKDDYNQGLPMFMDLVRSYKDNQE
jgi:hypothetical protein